MDITKLLEMIGSQIGMEVFQFTVKTTIVNNYIVRSYRDVIVVTNTPTMRTNKHIHRKEWNASCNYMEWLGQKLYYHKVDLFISVLCIGQKTHIELL